MPPKLRNLPLLVSAVGPTGSVIGTDISPGMLRQATRLARSGAITTVSLLQQDGARVSLEAPVDAVLFSLSYSVMPNRHEALALA